MVIFVFCAKKQYLQVPICRFSHNFGRGAIGGGMMSLMAMLLPMMTCIHLLEVIFEFYGKFHPRAPEE